jgi:hypothetical protein
LNQSLLSLTRSRSRSLSLEYRLQATRNTWNTSYPHYSASFTTNDRRDRPQWPDFRILARAARDPPARCSGSAALGRLLFPPSSDHSCARYISKILRRPPGILGQPPALFTPQVSRSTNPGIVRNDRIPLARNSGSGPARPLLRIRRIRPTSPPSLVRSLPRSLHLKYPSQTTWNTWTTSRSPHPASFAFNEPRDRPQRVDLALLVRAARDPPARCSGSTALDQLLLPSLVRSLPRSLHLKDRSQTPTTLGQPPALFTPQVSRSTNPGIAHNDRISPGLQ